MHYYKRNLGDYAKKTGRLSMLQHGAYTILMDSCYDREEFPTKEQAIEWTWASTPEEVAAVEFVLARFFVLTDGRYVQDRIAEELGKYKRNAEINARIANERETKRKEESTNRARTVHEPPPNHKPLTTNQEPEEQQLCAPPVGDAPLRADPIPYQAIVGMYNSTLTNLPKVRELTTKRKTLIRSAWQASRDRQDTRFWEAYFATCSGDPFLNGTGPYRNGHENWRPDFDFLLRADTVTKTYERAMDAMERMA